MRWCVAPAMDKTLIRALVPTDKIGFVGWIFEGYEYIGLVSTIDHVTGEIVVRTTPDLYREAYDILINMPFPVQIL